MTSPSCVELSVKDQRVDITVVAVSVGADLSVTVLGGDRPHIGSCVLSVTSESLITPAKSTTTTSILNIPGHKDDSPLSAMSKKLASSLGKNVSVCGGIHIDKITAEEIERVEQAVVLLTDRLIAELSKPIA